MKSKDENKVGVIGIASQNMMEEYLQKLELAQEADLNSTGEGDASFTQNKSPNLLFLQKARKGKGIIANKDFMQILFITCFLPFILPNFPALKDSEVKFAKKNERVVARLFEDTFH